jgi:hypothetical protein
MYTSCRFAFYIFSCTLIFMYICQQRFTLNHDNQLVYTSGEWSGHVIGVSGFIFKVRHTLLLSQLLC